MTGPAVVGLDLSLTATGIAHPDGTTTTIRTRTRGMERLGVIAAGILEAVETADTDPFVCIEGYSFGSRASQAHALGELGGVVRWSLWSTGVTYLDVPPSTLKTYATGKGNAGKVDVIVAARDRLGYTGTDDNEADSLWLRCIGLDLLGAPVVKLPQTHRRALTKLTVPTVPRPTVLDGLGAGS